MRSTIRNRAVVWGVALAIGLGAISPAIVAADEAPTEAPAGGEDPIALFEAGTKAFKEGRLEEAYTNLHRSFELKASFDTAANLSFVESSLGKTRDAATHLAYALKVFPATGDDSLRERMKADLAKLEVDIGRIVIDCPAGTVLTANGQAIGLAPVELVYVDPGEITIEGKHPDLGDGTAKVTVPKGEQVQVKLELVPRTVHEGEKAVWPGVLLGVLGAVGVGIGIGGIVAAEGAHSDAEDMAATLPDGACGTDGTACTDLADTLSDANTFSIMGITGFAVGGAALLGMIIYLAVPAPSPDPTSQVQLLPVFGPGYGGLLLEGRF